MTFDATNAQARSAAGIFGGGRQSGVGAHKRFKLVGQVEDFLQNVKAAFAVVIGLGVKCLK